MTVYAPPNGEVGDTSAIPALDVVGASVDNVVNDAMPVLDPAINSGMGVPMNSPTEVENIGEDMCADFGDQLLDVMVEVESCDGPVLEAVEEGNNLFNWLAQVFIHS